MSRRRFIARPGTPAASGFDIGITMTRVGEAPAQQYQTPAEEPPPAVAAGFGEGPIGHFIADDGVNTYFAVDFFGTPLGTINAFTVEDAGTGVAVSLNYTLPTNCAAIMAFSSFTGTAYVDIECLYDDNETLTALGVELTTP